MDPLFKEVGIYAALGQRYEPVDSRARPELPRGARRPGPRGGHHRGGLDGLASRPRRRRTRPTAIPMIPFYIFYSMFGFQRTGDQIWALGDARGRGLPDGRDRRPDDAHTARASSTTTATAISSPRRSRPSAPTTRPSPTSSPPIVRDGIERMYVHGEDVFYYVTLYNENYPSRPSPTASTRGSSAGSTASPRRPTAWRAPAHRARLVGSGSILQQVVAAQRAPRRAVRRRGRGLQRAVVPAAPARRARGRALEPAPPGQEARGSRTSSTVLGPDGGPIVDRLGLAARRCPTWFARGCRPYNVSLGTDGFGRSDNREALRSLFEIDGPSIAAAALSGLARCGGLDPKAAAKGIRALGIDPEKTDPLAL